MVFGLRPNLPNSIDGEPLTVQISDLVTSFPYDRLPENPFVSFFMRPEVPFILVILYLASKSTITSICSTFGITGKSDTFKYCVAAHNFSLAIFSLIVLVNSVPLVLSHLMEKGMEAIYCDQDGSLWSTEGGLGAWATIFYISKYYEFIDTWILLMKVRFFFLTNHILRKTFTHQLTNFLEYFFFQKLQRAKKLLCSKHITTPVLFLLCGAR